MANVADELRIPSLAQVKKMVEDIDASDVGALKVYGNLSTLGLVESTATAESIVTAMEVNSMLLHECTGSATSATLKFPSNYSLLKVIKKTNNYAEFECRIGINIWYGYYNAADSTQWRGWYQHFKSDGSMAMSGDLKIKKADRTAKYPNSHILLEQLSTGVAGMYNMTTNSIYTGLAVNPIYEESTTAPKALFRVKNPNIDRWYELHHLGNKPNGTYTGNGSATARVIDTGGIGKACVICTGSASGLLTSGGFIGKAGTELVVLTRDGAYFDGGIIHITTTSGAVNYNGSSYYYQVI